MTDSAMSHAGTTRRTWRFPRPVFEDTIALTVMLWAGLVIVVLGITLAIARYTEVPGSVWEYATNAAGWYVAAFGGYTAYYTIPMYVANGRTRRDSTIETALFLIALSAAVALLVTAGYLIEYVVHGIAGWPRSLAGNYLFAAHTDVAMVFAHYWISLLVWSAAGTLVGSAFYRFSALGWFALFPAAILVSVVGAVTQTYWGPPGDFIDLFSFPEAPALPLAIVAAVGCCLAAISLTWPILRDMPIRNR